MLVYCFILIRYLFVLGYKVKDAPHPVYLNIGYREVFFLDVDVISDNISKMKFKNITIL